MRNLLIISILIFSFGLSTSVFAEDKGKHKGPEISVEHKSEQGLEHGKAYAGTKEKKDKGDKDKGDKEEKKDKGDKDKGDKEEKKDKDKGDKKEKKDKDKGDKKEKKVKKGKKSK